MSHQRILQITLIFVIFISALINGSVSAPYTNIMGVSVALLGLLLVPLQTATPETRGVMTQVTLIFLGIGLLIGIQITQMPFFFPIDPIWRETSNILDFSYGTISSNPSKTLAAFPALILPGIVFSITLLLCQDVYAATRMWLLLSMVGFAIVATSIILEWLFPEVKFFSQYQVSFGTFSGVFVNRNVAASFFGLTAFALAGSIAIVSANRQVTKGQEAKNRSTFEYVLILMLFMTLIAIIATRSRAGMIFSFGTFFLCLAIIFAQNAKQKRGQIVFLVLLGGALLAAFFGEPVFSRLNSTSQDLRPCAWSSTLMAIRENIWFGAGFGTFADVFPAYRDVECLGTAGTWQRAHNSYLEFVLGLGAPAAIAVLFLAYRLIIMCCLAGLKQRKSLKPIVVLTLGVLAFISLHSFVDFPLQIPGVAYYFASLLAAGCSISIFKTKFKKKRKS